MKLWSRGDIYVAFCYICGSSIVSFWYLHLLILNRSHALCTSTFAFFTAASIHFYLYEFSISFCGGGRCCFDNSFTYFSFQLQNLSIAGNLFILPSRPFILFASLCAFLLSVRLQFVKCNPQYSKITPCSLTFL